MLPNFARLGSVFRWSIGLLLVVSACQSDPAPAPRRPNLDALPETSFTLLPAAETGIAFANRLPEDYYRNILRYQYYYNGGGVALADFNGDGRLDVCFSGNLQAPQLYLNQGDWKFALATKARLDLPGPSWTTGISVADVNADGHPDIYLCRSGNLREDNRRNLLYINDGQGTFSEQAARYGLDDPGYGMQAAWFDYDKDGDLDVYLANHAINFYGNGNTQGAGKTDAYAGDKLLRNDGGRFVNVTRSAGMKEAADSYGLGIAIGDLNGDGWDDVYVSNDYHVPDYCYLNQGDGTFREAGGEVMRQTSFFSMGSDLGDLNNDGLPDLMVVDMAPDDHRRRLTNIGGITYEEHLGNLRKGHGHQYMFNAVQLNNGNGTFSNVAALTGMQETDWSWAPLIADLDNDGRQDVYVTNGLRKDVLNLDFINYVSPEFAKFTDARGQLPEDAFRRLLAELPETQLANHCYRNLGELNFEPVAREWGLNQPSWSNGAAYGDLDGDGDLDLVVNNLDQAAFVYRNEGSGGKAIRLRLQGPQGNSQGLGAHVYFTTSAGTQYRQAYFNRGFLSAVEPVVHVGVGEESEAEVRVVWPDGKEQTLTVTAGAVVPVHYRDAKANSTPVESEQALLRELKAGPPIAHRENDYDDFKRDFLLPRKLSAEGPYLSTTGTGEGQLLYQGGSAGNAGQLLRRSAGAWLMVNGPWERHREREDAGSVWLDYDGDGDRDLYVASGGAEFAAEHENYRDRLYRQEEDGRFTSVELPDLRHSSGQVRVADYDNDGDPDLLIGGQVQVGAYPLPGTTVLLRNEDGQFVPAPLPDEGEWGMVNDLRWTDFDGDGDRDILAVGEWMQPRFFSNQGGQFVEASGETGLPDLTGWYHGITPGDFDGDGDTDYVVGNLGLNHRYRATPDAPFGLLAGDYDGNGSIDPLLGPTVDGRLVPLHGRQVLREQLNYVQKDFPSYSGFADAGLDDIIGERADRTQWEARATTAASLYLENLGGGRFDYRPLPRLAQVSAVRSGLAADVNSDGHLDLLLAGNTYETEYRTPRSDASTGLVLLGDGSGSFTPVRSKDSGFWATGNVRGLYRLGDSDTVLVVRNDGPVTAFSWTSALSRK
jgi:hypothetical protein